MSDWDDDFGVSQEDLDALHMEREILTGLTPANQARKILDEASPMAAMQLVRLAQHGATDTVRLNASKEILNRVGVVEGDGKNGEGKEPWENLFGKVVKDIEAYANVGSNGDGETTEGGE